MQKISPFLWFEKDAKAVGDFYCSVFKESKILNSNTISETPSGSVEIVNIELFGQQFTLMSAGPQYRFTEAISFVVSCDGQEEVDYYWDSLTSGGGEPGNCGWLKDKYGVSWQVIPTQMGELMGDSDPVIAAYAAQAMMKMNKIVIAELKEE
jgi:predicted 3-demethylubiquinone-9 3-methyltransferase (glyoxalase superfamily)